MPIVSGAELWRWRSLAQQAAIAANISPEEVDWLLQELAGLDRLSLRLKPKTAIDLKVSIDQLNQLWQQRIEAFVPIQYLAGSTPWRNFDLKVSPAVLIPRPETELVIDLAIAKATPAQQAGRWVDLGTGSGAIAIGLALAFPRATIHAVDQSSEALAIAQLNAKDLKIQFHQGSWFEPIAVLKGKLSGVVSNPPYIPTQIVQELQPEVRLHEPHLALDGGKDGLKSIRQIVETAPDYLQSGGVWIVEMMAGQAEAVVQLLESQGSYEQIEIHRDLAGLDRFAVARRI